MHIAVFIKKTTLHKNYGGLETMNKTLCEGLAKLGHKIDVFSPAYELPFENKSEIAVNYYFIKSDYQYFLSHKNKDSWYNKSSNFFKKLHADAPYDLVISQSSAGIGIINRKKELNVKVVSVAHGSTLGELRTSFNNISTSLDILKFALKLQYAIRQIFGRQRQFILGSDKVVAVSNAVKNQLLFETNAPVSTFSVIHNGIMPFENISSNEKRSDFVYIGQLIKDKGLDLFIEMQDDARFSGKILDIIGDGPYSSLITTFNENKKPGLQINLLGKLEYPEILKYLGQNSKQIFLFPTRRIEGFPMVLVEAMFAGMPIVTFDLGGVSDAVKNEFNGYLVKQGNTEEFKSTAMNLLNNNEKLVKYGQNGRKYALEHFTVDIMLNKYINLFDEVLKNENL